MCGFCGLATEAYLSSPYPWIVKSAAERRFSEPLATLSLSASAAAAAAAAASLTTDPLAAEDLLLSWYSLYQPRPAPAAPGPMLAAMSTLMMPAAAMTLAGHPLSSLPPQPKPADLLTLPGPLPIAHLTLKAMNGHNSAAALANGLALGAGTNLCLSNGSMIGNGGGGSSNSNKAGRHQVRKPRSLTLRSLSLISSSPFFTHSHFNTE